MGVLDLACCMYHCVSPHPKTQRAAASSLDASATGTNAATPAHTHHLAFPSMLKNLGVLRLAARQARSMMTYGGSPQPGVSVIGAPFRGGQPKGKLHPLSDGTSVTEICVTHALPRRGIPARSVPSYLLHTLSQYCLCSYPPCARLCGAMCSGRIGFLWCATLLHG